jgi:cellulose synthase/poly-beta-1,6-N-acetylglucosamine synthase-like glycosyltransferase
MPDYPREKLQIILAIEPDDPQTWAALQRLHLRKPFEIRVAPQAGPRTKPKALNAALAFATGTYTVVYDAEDRPEPDQLRRAAARFHADDVACVQARLTIDNTADSWLARVFTAEYAAQFDLFLPGLARLRLALPLGGSSNHFRGIRQQTHPLSGEFATEYRIFAPMCCAMSADGIRTM